LPEATTPLILRVSTPKSKTHRSGPALAWLQCSLVRPSSPRLSPRRRLSSPLSARVSPPRCGFVPAAKNSGARSETASTRACGALRCKKGAVAWQRGVVSRKCWRCCWRQKMRAHWELGRLARSGVWMPRSSEGRYRRIAGEICDGTDVPWAQPGEGVSSAGPRHAFDKQCTQSSPSWPWCLRQLLVVGSACGRGLSLRGVSGAVLVAVNMLITDGSGPCICALVLVLSLWSRPRRPPAPCPPRTRA
jgi:hypothetical protein